MSLTTHSKLQYYRHNYGQVCMTGLLGGRWHRYQQSQRDSRKRDLVHCCLVSIAFLYMLWFFYYWMVIENNIYFISLYMYIQVEQYIPWYELALGFSAAMVAYFSVILILWLLHVKYGHQVYIHPGHLVMTSLTLGSCIVISTLTNIYWPQLTPVAFESLKVFGPFIQLAAVILLTCISWFVAREWYKLSYYVVKIVWLVFLIILMLGVYLSPMGIKSPMLRSTTPPRPDIIALGGASSHAPENTMFAFKKAIDFGVTKLHTTVQISADSVPFLLSYNSLVATTDAREKLKGNYTSSPMFLDISTLQTLNTGSWFLQDDPWGTVYRLTESEKAEIMTQTFATLVEFLEFVMQYPDVEVFLTVMPVPAGHPCVCVADDIIDETLSNVSNLNRSRIYLPVTIQNNDSSPRLIEHFINQEYLHKRIKAALLSVDKDTVDAILMYNDLGIVTVVSSVNSYWLFSLAWCYGSQLISTHFVQHILSISGPMWELNESSYLGLWITIDLLSFVVIAVMFMYYKIKLYGTNFSPESISLNTGRSRTSYRSRTMKEKLLREGAIIDSMDELEARENNGVDNRPAYSMMSGQQALSLSSFAVNDMMARDRDTSASMSAVESGLAPPVTVTNRYSV